MLFYVSNVIVQEKLGILHYTFLCSFNLPTVNVNFCSVGREMTLHMSRQDASVD